jgi:hypothetical protein
MAPQDRKGANDAMRHDSDLLTEMCVGGEVEEGSPKQLHDSFKHVMPRLNAEEPRRTFSRWRRNLSSLNMSSSQGTMLACVN